MKRILVPTDFSPTAEKAFRVAMDLATRSKGTIILYHNYTPLNSVFVETAIQRREFNLHMEDDILKQLNRLKKKVAGHAVGVAVSTVVGHSPFIEDLFRCVDDNEADLIVMGTQGCSGLQKTIIGSVAGIVAGKSRLPVLLVPEKYELNEPRQFVFATRLANEDRSAYIKVHQMATLYEAGVTVMHFQNQFAPDIEKRKAAIDFDAYKLYLQQSLIENTAAFKLIEVESINSALENLDKTFNYDVMAMVRTNRSFSEKLFSKSFTKNMAYITKKPLLIIPEEVSVNSGQS